MDLVGGADVRTVSEELAKLADACVREAFTITEEALVADLGRPERSGFAVIGLGKLGSRELNYSSDLDVLFVYRGDGASANDIALDSLNISSVPEPASYALVALGLLWIWKGHKIVETRLDMSRQGVV